MSTLKASANAQGIALMIFGMLGLAVTDAMLKMLGGTVPVGQLMVIQGVGGTLLFGTLALRGGAQHWRKHFVMPVVMYRNIAEVVAVASFLTALVLVPLSTISSILQANPLLVTVGAAIWFKAPVGPRRWSAILVGLFGVLLITQPWAAGFDAAILLCVIATVALSLRDLITRRLPPEVTTLQAATYAVAVMAGLGVAILLITDQTWVTPSLHEAVFLGTTVLTMAAGYFGVTAAMRVGDIAVITPFRYSRIVFALILAIWFFDERPDALTYLGAAIVVTSGLYMTWREARIAKA